MISVEKWTTIRNLAREGYGKKAIARMLKVSRNTVRKALSSGEPPQYIRRVKGDTLIDPYRDQIEKMYLEKGLIGTRIYNELLKLGYTGSLTTLYRYLETLKNEPKEKVTVRFETGPAVQAQFDWSPYKVLIAGREQLVYCFLLILSYSRYKYMTFSLDQHLNSVIEALEEGLNFFGGVPLEILIDNAKQMVFATLKDNVKCFHETFLTLAGMYSFKPVACQVRRARTKGKVERPFYTVEQHFLKGNEFSSMEDLFTRGHKFLEEWNLKEHSTTLKPPAELFLEEKELLLPLPYRRYSDSLREFRKVSWDCLVSVKGSRYSVPSEYAGKKVFIKLEHGYLLKIFALDGTQLCSHELSSKKGTTNIKQEHYAALRPAPKSVPRIREVFSSTFKSGALFYQGLQNRVGLNAAYHAQKILLLREYYEDDAIEQSLAKALSFKAFSHEVVTNILRQFPFKETAPFISGKLPQEAGHLPRPLSYYNALIH